MKEAQGFLPVRRRACGAVALACGAFMLCVLPLLYHDALFDINRYKVTAVRAVIPALWLAMGLAILLRGRPFRFPHGLKIIRVPCLLMGLFALACVCSGAMAGFESAVLLGDKGRYAGLLFLLSCAAAFFLIALWLPRGEILPAAVALCGACVALLGTANRAGLDPLGFYAQIRRGQEQVFLATIGHMDFFGTYLLMPFSLAGGLCVFGKSLRMRAFGAVCAVFMLLGLAAARTESAVLGTSLACFALFALSGDSLSRMASALALWGAGFLAQPAVYALALRSPYRPAYSGLPLALAGKGAGLALGTLLLAAALCLCVLARRGVRAPGRRKLSLLCAALAAVAMLVLLGAIVYFTVFAPQFPLGAAADILRFDDSWGSLRGFVYVRALRAYADFSPMEKLFGRGIELTERILTPYFDNPAMLVGGIFNDAHCQPLQMLITCGLFGSAAFVGFYLTMLYLLLRRAGRDPVLVGVFAAVASYAVTLLINVTQPILIASFFSLCALGAARVRAQSAPNQEDAKDEP